MSGARWILIACAAALIAGAGRAGERQGGDAGSTVPLMDPVALLQGRIDSGEVRLEYSPVRGYLDAVLEALEVPVSSQTLVFSKTSLQADLIGPEEPRALYFSDDVYVGFVKRGPLLELGVIDPVRGTIFYTLDQEESEQPRFQVEGIRCISCHLPSRSDIPVPRLMVMSVVPNEAGQAVGTDVALIDDSSPMARRWGGWYVTGTGGDRIHRGNSLIGSDDPRWAIGVSSHQDALDGFFDATSYLADTSDIVALLLLTHQSEVHNLIGDAGYAVRAAIEAEEARERFLSDPDRAYSEVTLNRVAEITEPLVRGLFFVDAAPLEGMVSGPSEFAREFAARGPRDRRGRSLRDLDPGNRLFRYPLSYLVYSEQFDALPDLAREYVFRRIREVLDGEDSSGRFEHLSGDDRQAIREILEDTLPAFLETSEN